MTPLRVSSVAAIVPAMTDPMQPVIAINKSLTDSRTPEQVAWTSMKARCLTKTNHNYPRYGARGIEVCDEWANDFRAFYRHMGPRPSPEHSIDRINNNGNYEPGNVRWATPLEQARNRSSNTMVEIDGVSKPLSEWCEINGIPKSTASARLSRGMAPVLAVTLQSQRVDLRHEEIQAIRALAGAGKSRAQIASGHGFSKSSIQRALTNPPLVTRRTRDEIDALKRAWGFVGAAFQSFDPHCDGCGFCESYEGAPGEKLAECALGRRAGDRAEECPAYAAHLEAQEVEV